MAFLHWSESFSLTAFDRNHKGRGVCLIEERLFMPMSLASWCSCGLNNATSAISHIRSDAPQISLSIPVSNVRTRLASHIR